MQQDLDIIALLTRPGTYVLGVFIWIITFLMRRVIETINPQLKKQADANSPKITYLTTGARWWNEVILYVLPVSLGMAFAWLKSDFFFDGIGDKGGKIMFGGAVGWFSGFLYKLLRKILQQKAGLDISTGPNGSSFPPPGGS